MAKGKTAAKKTAVKPVPESLLEPAQFVNVYCAVLKGLLANPSFVGHGSTLESDEQVKKLTKKAHDIASIAMQKPAETDEEITDPELEEEA